GKAPPGGAPEPEVRGRDRARDPACEGRRARGLRRCVVRTGRAFGEGAVIDRERLERRMAALARIGSRDTAVSRLGLSADEQRARDLVGEWLSKRGAEARRDAAANLFARFGGDGVVHHVEVSTYSVKVRIGFGFALGFNCV